MNQRLERVDAEPPGEPLHPLPRLTAAFQGWIQHDLAIGPALEPALIFQLPFRRAKPLVGPAEAAKIVQVRLDQTLLHQVGQFDECSAADGAHERIHGGIVGGVLPLRQSSSGDAGAAVGNVD